MDTKALAVYISLLLFCLNLAKSAYAEVVYNDGQTHNIDSPVNDDVRVRDSAIGETTTVNLMTGGSMDTFFGHDNSRINMSGGMVNYNLRGYNNARLDVSGGEIGVNLITLGTSTATISDVWISDSLWAQGDSEVTLSGGHIDVHLQAEENSTVTITGGAIGSQLYARGNSEVTIYDCTIGSNLRAYNNSHVIMSGGTIGYMIEAGYYAEDTSTITFIGSDFAVNRIGVDYGEYDASDWASGTLTGTLANDDYLDALFYINADSKIILVPEPATFLLLGIGGMLLRRKHEK